MIWHWDVWLRFLDAHYFDLMTVLIKKYLKKVI